MSATKDVLCFATYLSTVNLDYGAGELDGTAFGGATITSGKLDLTGGVVANVRYHAHGNAEFGQDGTIRFKYTPNYSGTPASSQIWVDLYPEDASDKDRVLFFQSSTGGSVKAFIYDSAGTLQGNIDFGAWSPTSGTEYEISFNFSSGATRLFIDGNQHGSTDTSTFTWDNWAHYFRVGASKSGTETANFSIDDLILYDEVQHTGHYESGYSLPLVPTIIELSGFVFDCCGPVESQTIKARPYQSGFINEGVFQQYKFTHLATTNSSGFFSAQMLVQPTGEEIEFKIGPQRYRTTLPATNTDFSDLTLVTIND